MVPITVKSLQIIVHGHISLFPKWHHSTKKQSLKAQYDDDSSLVPDFVRAFDKTSQSATIFCTNPSSAFLSFEEEEEKEEEEGNSPDSHQPINVNVNMTRKFTTMLPPTLPPSFTGTSTKIFYLASSKIKFSDGTSKICHVPFTVLSVKCSAISSSDKLPTLNAADLLAVAQLPYRLKIGECNFVASSKSEEGLIFRKGQWLSTKETVNLHQKSNGGNGGNSNSSISDNSQKTMSKFILENFYCDR